MYCILCAVKVVFMDYHSILNADQTPIKPISRGKNNRELDTAMHFSGRLFESLISHGGGSSGQELASSPQHAGQPDSWHISSGPQVQQLLPAVMSISTSHAGLSAGHVELSLLHSMLASRLRSTSHRAPRCSNPRRLVLAGDDGERLSCLGVLVRALEAQRPR